MHLIEKIKKFVRKFRRQNLVIGPIDAQRLFNKLCNNFRTQLIDSEENQIHGNYMKEQFDKEHPFPEGWYC